MECDVGILLRPPRNGTKTKNGSNYPHRKRLHVNYFTSPPWSRTPATSSCWPTARHSLELISCGGAAVAMIGCEKKSETTTGTSSSGSTPTTMESAKQSAENAANKATDKAKEMG